MEILLTGGTGLVGRTLCKVLVDRGHGVFVLTRQTGTAKSSDTKGVEYLPWVDLPAAAKRAKFDAVIHLAGEPLFPGRWTSSKKRRVRESRVEILRRLAKTLAHAGQSPSCLISASAVGYYGDRADEILDETSASGEDFLANLCKEWESVVQHETVTLFPNMRTVSLRFGVVLDKNGGALANLLPIFRMGLGGTLGNGKQWMSWIHLEDACRVTLFALENGSLRGSINTVAPNPVTNAEFTQKLARTLGRWAFLPVPSIAIRLLLGEAARVVLDSQRVRPKNLTDAGFHFRYPNLEDTFRDILS